MKVGTRVATGQDWGNGPSPKEGCGAVSHGPGKAHTATQRAAPSPSSRARAWPRSLGLWATEASTHLLLRMGLDPQHWPGRDWPRTSGQQSRQEQCLPKVGPSQPGASTEVSTALRTQSSCAIKVVLQCIVGTRQSEVQIPLLPLSAP